MNLLKRLKTILHVQDTPDSKYGREWRWQPLISFYPALAISLELQLIRWEGKPQDPRTVASYDLQFYYNPLKWAIKTDHFYYDGPHCLWQLGPIAVSRDGFGDCKLCSDSTR